MATSNVYLEIYETLASSDPLGTSGTENSNSSIEVLDFSFSIEQKYSAEEDGRAGFVERVDKTPLKITKRADKISPKLFGFCCKGNMLYKVELTRRGPRSTEKENDSEGLTKILKLFRKSSNASCLRFRFQAYQKMTT